MPLHPQIAWNPPHQSIPAVTNPTPSVHLLHLGLPGGGDGTPGHLERCDDRSRPRLEIVKMSLGFATYGGSGVLREGDEAIDQAGFSTYWF